MRIGKITEFEMTTVTFVEIFFNPLILIYFYDNKIYFYDKKIVYKRELKHVGILFFVVA